MVQHNEDELEKFIIRMPRGMRQRIKAAAVSNNRSMNAEIVSALEDQFPAPTTDWLHLSLPLIEETILKYKSAGTDEERLAFQKQLLQLTGSIPPE
ncbi:MAG: Arc family DNA-binding protein [Pseudomonadota bacterium]